MSGDNGLSSTRLALRAGSWLLILDRRMNGGNEVGTIVEATCECGYQKGMALGGGFADFTERNAFPYLCEKCSDIVVLNAMDPSPCCNQCQWDGVVPYSKPSMFLDKPLNGTVYEWGEYPSSDILREPSAEAYVEAWFRSFESVTVDEPEADDLLREEAVDRLKLTGELIAKYQATWQKIRAGEYLTLYDCGYPCPKCKRETMHFEYAGSWD